MLHSDTISFLTELKNNNNRIWFEANRQRYETVRQYAQAFATTMLEELQSIDSYLAGVKPKDCLFRIHRDIRFSNDKSPYKTHIGIIFTPNRRYAEHAGYYLHIEPDNCFIGGGIYMPSSNLVKQIRTEIAHSCDEISAILSNPNFTTYFSDFDYEDGLFLKKPPQGYSNSHPCIEWLKLKSFTVSKNFDHQIIKSTDLKNFALNHFKAIKPLNDFLNQSIHW